MCVLKRMGCCESLRNPEKTKIVEVQTVPKKLEFCKTPIKSVIICSNYMCQQHPVHVCPREVIVNVPETIEKIAYDSHDVICSGAEATFSRYEEGRTYNYKTITSERKYLHKINRGVKITCKESISYTDGNKKILVIKPDMRSYDLPYRTDLRLCLCSDGINVYHANSLVKTSQQIDQLQSQVSTAWPDHKKNICVEKISPDGATSIIIEYKNGRRTLFKFAQGKIEYPI